MKIMADETDEVSRETLLAKFLDDEALNDFSLEGTDGVRVLANRGILGAKSRVFRQMLFGSFAEASSPVVKIGYEGAVLRAIVEYIHTDTAQVLRDVCEEPLQHVQTLIQLTEAALYFNLPGLCQKSQQCLSQTVQGDLLSSFVVMEAAEEVGPSIPREVSKAALANVRNHLKEVLKDDTTVPLLSSAVVEEILQDTEHQIPEIELFRLLQLWAQSDAGRLPTAQKLARHIRLELMDPIQVSETILPSGLVTEQQLWKACNSAANHNQTLPRKRTRRLLQWKGQPQSDVITSEARTQQVKLLDYPEMTSGVYQWTLQVQGPCRQTWLGMAHTGLAAGVDTNTFLGFQKNGWVYSSAGSAYHNNRMVAHGKSPFAVGSKVTMTLDLRGLGALSASVDGGESFELFSNFQVEGLSGGFVPAVSLTAPGSVRILDVRQIS